MNDVYKKLDQEIQQYYSGLSENTGQVNEPAVAYDTFLDSPMRVVHAINSGIPYRIFKLIKEESPFDDDEWANFLNISRRSLDRFKASGDHIFKPAHAEKIFELAEVTQLGAQVFDSRKQFYDWLNTPSFALGSFKPIDLLSNSFGKNIVLNELHHIDQGIFA
ncbi:MULTISPECIES: antitoxin Xre-like helix-turn-helix domain-containing protein [unclassified Leeuwenhoekiella]|uniref:type II RES/Xre toxin-antitoxin system antitoxin n=1 Tax=unclassified Leeuwenhoekiella TaxID=2615029 RepID=UPI000C6AB332|nr:MULTISPECIES: antitoxin Xre-like helix-turn-helix domain-containing protein [unclassified Leeuwenhoekiella]MAW94868.1 antitoxin [Leeuwenhoekiella sp.]MBA79588.1 antitoxin [Leeuwenhoekiella sp.]|tara:strand:+ start:5124 stop:5612 length:489 start_codon:yes stop_codon:yes gene_type:complete